MAAADTPQTGRQRRWRLAVALLIAALATIALWQLDTLRPLDQLAREALFRATTAKVDSAITIVEIDAGSIAEVGAWPWPRELHARALEQLAAAGVASVTVDIDLSARSQPAADDRLAAALEALAREAPVRLPVFVQRRSLADATPVVSQPLPAFRRHAELVTVNMRPEEDGLVRYLPAELDTGAARYPGAWNALAGVYGLPTWIDYRIAPASFDTLPFTALLNGDVPEARLAGRDVLIGATAIELGDIIAVPVHRVLPGVVLQALGAETLARGGLYPASVGLEVGLLLLVAVLGGALLVRLSWRGGLVAAGGFTLAWPALGAFALTQWHLLLPLAAPVTLAWLAYVALTVARLDLETVERVLAQMRLGDERALLDRIIATANDCILCTNAEGCILRANRAACALIGRDETGLLGQPLADWLPAASFGMGALGARPFDTGLHDADGHRVPVEATVSSLVLSREHIHTVVLRDLTERVERERALQYEATHDALTGLLNRQELFRRVEEDCAVHTAGTLIVLDLDHFREVNDAYGHDAGDDLLRQTAERLRAGAGAAVVARVGGDTFALWWPAGHHGTAPEAGAEAVRALLQPPFRIPGADDDAWIEIDGTLGLTEAARPRPNTDAPAPSAGVAERLLREASDALLAAREAGWQLRRYSDADSRERGRRIELVPAIRRAIRNDELRLVYQPKIALDSDAVAGCEVLLRWPAGEEAGIGLGTLIELAEDSRQIGPLTEWVLDSLLANEGAWQTRGLPRGIAVNLSARLIEDETFMLGLQRLLRECAGYYRFEFEITESALLRRRERATRLLAGLRAAGAHIAIDDYGTGYSSLAYLRDLAASTLKLDRSFVTGIRTHPGNQVIVRSTVRMAHELGLQVVGEGVETADDEGFLRAHGCDLAQGYHYARPLDEAALEQWLARRGPPRSASK